LDDIVARGVTPAEDLIEKFKGPWGGSVEPVFAEQSY
jgi:glutamate--cysteine ligase